MPVYKYVNILPIYNKYSKATNVALQDTLYQITIEEELLADINTLVSKERKHTKRYKWYQLLRKNIKRYRYWKTSTSKICSWKFCKKEY